MAIEMANGADIAAAAGAAVGTSVVVGATESVVCIELKKMKAKRKCQVDVCVVQGTSRTKRATATEGGGGEVCLKGAVRRVWWSTWPCKL